MVYFIVILYAISLLLIFLFSIGQLHLTYKYLRSKKEKQNGVPMPLMENFPFVTIQLPIYNEKYVVERLLSSIANIEYPKDRLEIQVLDDSTDDTVSLVADKVVALQNSGLDIQHVQRTNREGFKAGALQYGMHSCKGEYIAIFDADFLPPSNFLLKTIPYFQDENIGMVQTRWGHINENFSILTKLQAFGLDAHFTIEQSGRNFSKSFINFNGTGGVWRKTAIKDAGGWSADTLTEDLDLSYRAQLKGWKFKYLEDVVTPAELPIIMSAIKSQQYRWNKGAAETAKKNLINVLRSKQRLSLKIHAIMHLLNSSIFLCILITALLSVPMLYIKEYNPQLSLLFKIGNIFLVGFLSISIFYWIANRAIRPSKNFYFIKMFPAFLTISMGLSLHNTIAVLEGYFGIKTPFIRTPKFNVIDNKSKWSGNVYLKPKLTLATSIEALLSIYFLFGIASGVILHDWGLLFFHGLLTIAFGFIFYQSIKPIKHVGQ